MCKYCNPWPAEPLFDNRDRLSRKKDAYPGIEVEIEALSGKMYIGACPDTYEPGWLEATIDINYCPMCGRDLREDKE